MPGLVAPFGSQLCCRCTPAPPMGPLRAGLTGLMWSTARLSRVSERPHESGPRAAESVSETEALCLVKGAVRRGILRQSTAGIIPFADVTRSALSFVQTVLHHRHGHLTSVPSAVDDEGSLRVDSFTVFVLWVTAVRRGILRQSTAGIIPFADVTRSALSFVQTVLHHRHGHLTSVPSAVDDEGWEM
ncbi:hypothetical protein SKAU_G00302100 [Synaphobranchus kaupii]|uniref:Uncharacterized protein n=1 Tax=Synaphobranchus kaupii TaxID=118154 RepID=A0A9Q1IME8_SYNKA|nr:hypothetical protein SKAU_G00302100 [Synaphobranchus kaupii]